MAFALMQLHRDATALLAQGACPHVCQRPAALYRKLGGTLEITARFPGSAVTGADVGEADGGLDRRQKFSPHPALLRSATLSREREREEAQLDFALATAAVIGTSS